MATITDTTEPPAAKTPKKSTARVSRETKLAASRIEALNGIGQLAQAGLVATGNLADAAAVDNHWPAISKEVSNLADSNEKVAAVVDRLSAVGPYTGLLMAVLPFAAQILVNHKRMPAGAMGTVSGELLEARMKLEIQQMELQIQRQQAEMERELMIMQARQADAQSETAAA